MTSYAVHESDIGFYDLVSTMLNKLHGQPNSYDKKLVSPFAIPSINITYDHVKNLHWTASYRA